MNSVARFCAFCLVVLAGCSNGEREPVIAAVTLATAPYKPASLAIQCGTLVDGISDQPKLNQTIIIREGRIAAIEQGNSKPSGMPIMDLHDYTCLPGLIEMHDHITETSDDT
ncbi:MAG: hypothetical protein ACJ8OJ_22365, partial [Povalibacter sp.]